VRVKGVGYRVLVTVAVELSVRVKVRVRVRVREHLSCRESLARYQSTAL